MVARAFVLRLPRQPGPAAGFVGLANYEKMLTDPDGLGAADTTAIIAVLTVAVQMVVGFLLAMLFSKQFPLRRYLLILVLTPMMLSFVAIGAFFRYYYEPTFGLLSASSCACSPASPTSCLRLPRAPSPASSSPTPGCGRPS